MCIRDRLKPTGYSWEELREEAPVYLPVEYYKYKTGKMRNDGQFMMVCSLNEVATVCRIGDCDGLEEPLRLRCV